MAQLPFKYPSTPFTAYTTSSPRPSTESSIISKTAFRSILRFFRSTKRKRAAKTPPSPERFKFIACFSKGKHPPTPQAGQETDSKRDSNSQSDDSDEIERSNSNSSVEETNTSEDGNSENNAMEIDVLGVSSDRFSLDIFRCSMEFAIESVKKREGSIVVGRAHGLALFIAKVLKVMNYSKEAKRRLKIMTVSGNQKGKKNPGTCKETANQEQIWRKPIMMGKRCRKLDEDFPYGKNKDERVAVAAAPKVRVAAVSKVMEDYRKALVPSAISLV